MDKPYHKKDPHAKREAEKYDKPIASRELIIQLLQDAAKPLSQTTIEKALQIKGNDPKEALRRRLRAMERDGQVICNRRNKYALVTSVELIPGRVVGRKEGYGLLIPDDGTGEMYLSPYQMQLVFPGDEVLVRSTGTDRRGRREASIVRVREHHTTQVVGRFYIEDGVNFVVPDSKNINQDVLIPTKKSKGAKHGEFVVAKIVSQPTRRLQATGEVVEVLGKKMSANLATDMAIRNHGLRHEWPKALQSSLKKISETISDEEIARRKDLRATPFVTIDGEDAKDFDDAVYCEPYKQGGWRLLVAIADVTHYVKPGTPLDEEAMLRGNSVYFPTHVIPMLPEVLSNGVCSLKPKVDRLVIVCDMVVNNEGLMTKWDFFEAVIHSHGRLTYQQVADWIERDENRDPALWPHVRELHRMYKKMHQRRTTRGALDFETTETRIIFSKKNVIEKIVPVERNDAHKIIEECMLKANVAAARFLLKAELPVLFRVHEGPEFEKLEKLRDFLKGVGLRLTGGEDPTSSDYAKLLDRIQNRPDAGLIQTVLLRSLAQAVYTPKNVGHFGLAYEEYCHFTSPIRRYPDVIIHRAIRHVLQNKKASDFYYELKEISDLGSHCSQSERSADYATRDVMDWLKCEYMQDRVGQEFTGVIIDIVGFGMFIELKEVYVEGLLHISGLHNEYFQHDQVHHRLTGQQSGKVYRLGDEIRVLVSRVDMEQREIDFVLPDLAEKKPARKVSKKAAKKKVKAKKKAKVSRKKDATDSKPNKKNRIKKQAKK